VDGVVVEVQDAKEVKRVPVSVRLMAVEREKEQGMFCSGEGAPGMQEAGDCSGIGTSMKMGMFVEGGYVREDLVAMEVVMGGVGEVVEGVPEVGPGVEQVMEGVGAVVEGVLEVMVGEDEVMEGVEEVRKG
jgi:hypothetical protein